MLASAIARAHAHAPPSTVDAAVILRLCVFNQCLCVRACAELRRQEETGQLVQPVLFVLLVLVSVLLYFAVSLMDPGFILSEDAALQVKVVS